MDLIWLFYVGGMAACTLAIPTLLVVMHLVTRTPDRPAGRGAARASAPADGAGLHA